VSEPPASASVFDLLERIRQRPGMWVGYDDEHWGDRLNAVEMLLTGYAHALDAHRIDEPGATFLEDFRAYLERKHGLRSSCGPIAAIKFACGNDAAAWERLWQLVDEFKSARQAT